MSYYTTFKTYNDVLDYLKTVDYPQCFKVNYKPDTDEYALWIGNQPYYIYEEWMNDAEQIVRAMKKENRILKIKVDNYKENWFKCLSNKSK